MGIGASILLLAIGSILAYAVQIDDALVAGITVDWDTVGVILMAIGALGLVWSLIVMSMARRDDRAAERDHLLDR